MYLLFTSKNNELKENKKYITCILITLATLTFLTSAFTDKYDKLFFEGLIYATEKEWKAVAWCGDTSIEIANERYFQLNDDKYKVFFFNRNRQWGFEDIFCNKSDRNEKILLSERNNNI